jgi:hypothetical protein
MSTSMRRCYARFATAIAPGMAPTPGMNSREFTYSSHASPARRRPSPVIPENVKRFILSSIPSVPYLEAALWLRAHAQADHGVDEVARALYLADADAGRLLAMLETSGVLTRAGSAGTPRFRYQPRDAALAARFDALSQAYSSNLVEIAKLVHDATHRNAHRFADAFKLRKDS